MSCFHSALSEVLLLTIKKTSLVLKLCYFCMFFQLDADRDEEEVFCDISTTLDNKLFPSKEPAAGKRSCFPSTDTPQDKLFSLNMQIHVVINLRAPIYFTN